MRSREEIMTALDCLFYATIEMASDQSYLDTFATTGATLKWVLGGEDDWMSAIIEKYKLAAAMRAKPGKPTPFVTSEFLQRDLQKEVEEG